MEYLVEFAIDVPAGTPPSEVAETFDQEAAAAARLVADGHLLRLWRPPAEAGETRALGLYRAEDQAELDGLLAALPVYDWMRVTVTTLGPHPNDPMVGGQRAMRDGLPSPRLTFVYRLEATLGQPLDLGDLAAGRRRIVPLTGGVVTGPRINGKLLPGASADWQLLEPDGTARGDIRYTLQTDAGDLLYVQSRSVRHGPAEVLARLARGEDVDPGEYTFRTATQIETGAVELSWLNKGVFVAVGGRSPAGVVYEVYLVE